MTRRWLMVLAAVIAVLALPAVASADLRQEEQRGQRIAEAVQAGERQCSDLSSGEFELIGEYAMGRYFQDTAAHESMNQRMVDAMGEQGERRMHIALGHRSSGCRGGPAWSWTGPMAAMMFGDSGSEAGGYDSGMMDGRGYRSEGDGDGSHGPSAAVMAAILAALIVAAALGVYWLSRRRGGSAPDSPLETLKRRYAAGELSKEQYEESRRLIEGD